MGGKKYGLNIFTYSRSKFAQILEWCWWYFHWLGLSGLIFLVRQASGASLARSGEVSLKKYKNIGHILAKMDICNHMRFYPAET